MRRALLLCTLVFCWSAGGAAQSSKSAPSQKVPQPTAKPVAASPAAVQAARASFAKLPLSFEENKGQTDNRVKYISRGAEYNLFLTADEAVIALRGGSANAAAPSKAAALWLKMLGANPSARVSGTDLLSGKINYYVGNDPSKWRTGVRQYGRVTYRSIYPGVDLTYYGNQQQLESDFVVEPGANPRSIEFRVAGAQNLSLDDQGNLVMLTSAGNVQLLRPEIYQIIKGVRRDIPGRYVLSGKDHVGFEIAKYDAQSPLIIDPILVYSTYLGGSSLSGGDGALAIAVDKNGHAYVTGSGTSSDFPGSDIAGPPVASLNDFAFVTELDSTGSSGTSLVYSTILSGSEQNGGSTSGNGISLDSSGNAYVAGTTGSSNFPMLNPFQATFGGASQTGIVVGLAPDGTLLYSTYFGGRNGQGANGYSDATILNGIYADPSTGNTYVVGNTTSANFPTISPLQSTLNVSSPDENLKNVVVAKFNPQGQPLYSTYLNGTNSNDTGTAIVADSAGNAYVTGETSSSNFPVQTSPAPFQTALAGSPDAFVVKLGFTGSAVTLAGGTYLGGTGTDEGMAIAIDSASTPNIYVAGQTTSSGTGTKAFPIKGPISGPGSYTGGTNGGGTDAFLTKISGDFTTVTYSTFLGGSGTDIAYGIALDGASPPNAFITGSTSSLNFPLVGSLQAVLGSVAAVNTFVAEVNGTGSALTYSTYLGGIGTDIALGIALDSSDNAYIAGKAGSANFPVVSGGAAGTNPFQGQLGTSAGNAFVAKISPAAPASALTFFPPSYNFHTVGIGGTTGFATEPVTLTNNTGSDVSISAFVMGGANSGDFAIQSASPSPCSTSVFPFTLPKGSSCTLLLRFTPMDQDARAATLSVTSNASSANVLTLTGSGGAPQVSFSPATVSFFPNPAPLNVQASAFVTVTNSGGGPLTIGSAQISAADAANAAPFSIVSGCASTTLNPGSSCSIELAYTPTTATTSNATLLLNTNAAGSPQTLSLTGTGVAEVIVEPTSIEYLQQIVGTSVANAMNDAREYSVENGSGANITLTVTSGTSASQGDFHIDNEFGLNACATGLVLPPGGECETALYFLPAAVSGVDGRTGSYTIAWNGPIASSQGVNLMGQGVTGIFLLTNTITASNEYVGFTEGTNTLETLFNGTSNPITVSITLTGNNPSDFAVSLDPTCAPNNVVPANTFCRVNTSFTPSALGLRSVTALFDYNGDNGDPLSLNGSGTGIPGPIVISVAGRQVSTFDFGSEIVNTTTPETRFLVRNAATVPATISSITPPGNSDFKFTSDTTCPASGTLQGGSSCFIGVTFSPSSVTNPPTKESTTFTFADTYAASVGADASSPHTITITGTGEPSLITVSVSTGTATLLDFGTVNLKPATAPIAEIFLTNAGNTATVINWSGGMPALDTPTGTDFSFSTTGINIVTCTNGKTVLPQGGSCQIAIQFNPQTAGPQTNSVTFTDTVSGGSPTTHKVMIQGNSVGQGQVSMTSTLIYTQLVNTTSAAAQTTTVTNTGTGPLTITQTLIDNFGTGTGQFNILPSSTCTTGTTLSPTSPGNTCTFNITFAAPATAGLSEAEIEVEANIGNNGTGFGDTFLEGNAVTGGLSLTPSGTINFGAVAVGSTANNNVFYQLMNNNASSVTMGTITVPAGYTVLDDSCSGQTIAATNSCDFELSFTPNTATTFNGNLSLTFTGTGVTGSPFMVAIQGSGVAALAANPNPLTFAGGVINSQQLNSVSLQNGSSSTVTITGFSALTGANPSLFSLPTSDNFCAGASGVLTGTNGTTPGGQCFFYVTFQSATAGNFSAQFNVNYTVNSNPQTLTVNVSASIPATTISVSPTTLTFNSQTLNTQSQVQFVTITNTSTNSNSYYEASNFQIQVTGTGNDFAIGPSGNGGSSCSFIEPGQSCNLPIIFTPTKTGSRTGTLTITGNSTPASQTVILNGTGSGGSVSTDTTSMSFPTTNVGSSTAQAIVLSNTTSSNATLSSLTYTGPYGPGTGPNACGVGTVVPATTGTCLIYVKFTPTGGTTNGTLSVAYNPGAVTLPLISFTGSQSNPIVSLTPTPTLTFPTVLEGSSVTMTATLTNGTASGITISSTPIVTTPGNATGDFTFASNTCTSGAPIASGGGSCTIGVKFAPQGVGSRTATLSVTDSEGTHTIGLSGTGTTPATITASGGATQSVAVNNAFPAALQALVEDSGSNPLSGVTVTFTAPSSGASGTFTGSLTTVQVTTGSNGIAVAPTFTANNTVGAYTVTAKAGTVGPANFSLTNLAGTPASISLTGTPQSAAIGTAFAGMQATVKDSNSLPLSGITVTFTAPATGPSGTFSTGGTTATALTNSSGVATAPAFTANNIAGGPYNVGATAGPVGPVNFVLTNLAGAPSSITATAGSGQSATINGTFTTTLQATVKDGGGNLLSGVIVTFTAPSSGASGTFVLTGSPVTTTATTNSSGVATAPSFKANSIAGSYSVNASVTGVGTPAQFSLTNNTGPASSIVTKTGTPQSVAVNTAFATNLQVTVTDSGGNPVNGVSVTFTAPASGASGTFASPGSGNTATVTTNSSGVATAPVFTSNSTIGSYTVNATVSGVGTPAAFSMSNIAGPPANIVTNAGTPQSEPINTAFATNLQAKVTDSGGNPVSGASVTFTAPASGASGTFASPGSGNTATVLTNSSGLAIAPVFTSDAIAASYTVNATVTGVGTPAAFSLTNTAGPAASVVTNAGTPQSEPIHTAFATNLQAKVTDSGGNPVSGASVTFTAPATGASGTFASPGSGNTATVTTNSSGVATAPVFTSNAVAASYTVNATVTGVGTPAAFSLTNTAGPAASIVTNAGTPQSEPINAAFATNLQAKVTDSGGNPVSGASVTFTAPATGASGTFASPGSGNTATVTTNSSGLASAPVFTSNSTAGSYTVNGTVTGVATPAAFSLTNIAGPAASVVANAGTPQSVAINTSFATALQAKVIDSGGNPVSGATVTFTVTAATNGASGTFTVNLTSAQATTNASGLASAPTFTANSISGGPYTVSAMTGTLTAATFSLTNLSAPPAAILATTGSGQSAVINAAFPTNLQATVNDSGGHPIAGASVTFTAPSSGASGTFASPGSGNIATVTTNASGVATAPAFTANSTAGGPYNIAATAGTVSANFSMTNLVGPPSTVTATAGTPQNVTIGGALPTTLKATVKDSGGNLLSGVVVTFTAPASGASGTFASPGTGNTATATTNSSGVATAPAFSANTTSGSYTVNGSVSGVATAAAFSLTNNAGPPSTIVTNSGTPQSVAVNTAFAAMQVTVKDGSGNGVSGVSVTFTAPASGASGTFAAPGSGNTATVTTNANGVAAAPTFTANNSVGGPYAVTAMVSGLTAANFSLTNLAGTPASIVTSSGTPQSVAINTVFAPLTATVKDSNSNPLSSVVVTFTAPTSGPSGTFAGGSTTATAMTNSSGLATAPTFTANSTAGGPYNVGATAGTLTAVIFSLTNLAGAPASVTATAGTPQSIAISTAFATSLQATVKDSGGNLLSGVIVTFTAPASGASGTFTGAVTTLQVTSNSSGIASAPFTANSTVGTYTVNATVSGVGTPAAFSLTNTAGPASSIVTNAGTPQNVAISTVFPTSLQAKVTDSGGNPISGASVTFTAPASGASGTFAAPGTGATATVTTNASGLATAPVFTADSTAGAYTVNATVTGVSTPAAFSLTNNVGSPATITATAGTPQNVAVTLAFPTALQATVKDSGGNLVSGASVTFTAPASGASGTFTGGTNGGLTAVVTSNSSGVATAPAFTANATGGTYNVNATVTGVATPAVFAMTNTVSPDVTIAKSHTGDFTVGANGTYTIKVTNNGTGPTTGTITVTDTLPTGLTFVSGAGTGWTCSAAAQLVTCTNATVGALAAKGGNSTTITLTVSVAPSAISSATNFTVTNSATVSDPGDLATTDKSSTDTPTNIDNAVPTQTAFSPSAGLIAGATSAQMITLTGTGFNSSTQVTIGSNSALTGTANTAGTSLTITIPVADLANAGNLAITVSNPKNPNSNAGGGTAPANQSFPLVGVTAVQDSSTSGTIPITAGTPATVKIDFTTTPTNAALPGSLTIACQVPMALTGLTCLPNPTTVSQGSTSGSSTITLNAVAMKASRSIPGGGGSGPWNLYLPWLVALALASMAGMIIASRASRGRAWQVRRAPGYAMLLLFAVTAVALVGCTTASAPTPTPTGPASVVVTATAADGASSSVTVQINVSN